MTLFDWIVLLIAASTCYLGAKQGFLSSALNLGAWVLAVFLAFAFGDLLVAILWPELPARIETWLVGNPLTAAIFRGPEVADSIALWGARLGILVLVLLVGTTISGLISRAVENSVFSSANRALGLLLGAAKGWLLAGALVLVLTHVGAAQLASRLHEPAVSAAGQRRAEPAAAILGRPVMCGVIGLMSRSPAAPDIYDGLIMLQHRGQDAAGILTDEDGMCRKRRARGLVRETFRTRHMHNLRGSAGLGHVRYPTAGSDRNSETQPFFVNSPYGIALAHNGNLTNAHELAQEMRMRDRRYLNTNSDSELLLNVFAHELLRTTRRGMDADAVFRAVRGVHRRCKGAYSVVCLILGYGLLAFRDPFGIRPMVVGRREGKDGPEYLVASESVALQQLGFELLRDVLPGEAWYFGYGEEAVTRQCAPRKQYTPCIFEYVYFARPDSLMDRISVHKARLRMGERLAEKILREGDTSDLDVVIPVPDTSRTSAMEVATRLNVKYREGFIKNRYIGRTFIMPGQEERSRSVRQKLNPINLEFRGKNVLLVDDSIVRGTTSRQIVEMAREAGAKKVWFASAAPPVRHQNVYGIDMPAPKELIATGRSVDEVQQRIGADRLVYQDLGDLISAVNFRHAEITGFDVSCFNGEYVTGGVDRQLLRRVARERSDGVRTGRRKLKRKRPKAAPPPSSKRPAAAPKAPRMAELPAFEAETS